MTPEEQRTLDLFEAVESRPDINQRQLANKLDISLGLANAFLRTVLSKGWVRARKVKARRWLYFLTPQGSLEKSRLSLNYLQRTLKSFRELRIKADLSLAKISSQGVSGVHLIGDEDWTDIVRLCLDKHRIHCLSKITRPRGEDINHTEWLPQKFQALKKDQRILITVIENREELLEELKNQDFEENKHWLTIT